MNGLFCVSGVSNVALDVIFMLCFTLVSVAVILLAVWLVSRYIVYDKDYKFALNFKGIVVLTLAIGVIVRLIFTFIVKGYREDYKIIAKLMEYVGEGGLGGYYKMNGTAVYPLTALIYSLFGLLTNLFGLTSVSVMTVFFVKLPLIVCDMFTAFILYKTAKKYVNEAVALIFAALFSIFPLFVFASGVWGSVYSILTLCLVLCMYFLSRKNYIGLFASYSAALLVHFDAIYLFPLIAVFAVYALIKAAKAVRIQRPADFSALIRDKERNPVFIIPVCMVCGFLLVYLLSLPLMLSASAGANPFKIVYALFLQPFSALKYFSYNGLSVFNIFVRNGVELGSGFPSAIFAVVFGVIILGIVLLIYLSKKNRANLTYLAGYILVTLSVYFIDFTALSIVPALGLMLFSFLLIRDKRILKIFAVLGLFAVFNASAVMVNAGYFNNAADSIFTGNALYTGSTLLTGAFGLTISIISSVFAVLTHIYATMVLLDFSMANKRKLFAENNKVGFFTSIKNWVKFK